MDLKLSADEIRWTKPIIDIIERVLMFTNDYWSWEREIETAKTAGSGRIVNIIAVWMKERSITAGEAKTVVKELIVSSEQEFIQARDRFYSENPTLSFRLRQWIDMAGFAAAGYSFWCARCPRHHAWREIRDKEEAYVRKLAAESAQKAAAVALSTNPLFSSTDYPGVGHVLDEWSHNPSPSYNSQGLPVGSLNPHQVQLCQANASNTGRAFGSMLSPLKGASSVEILMQNDRRPLLGTKTIPLPGQASKVSA